MKSGKEYKLMKDPAGGYKPHKDAHLSQLTLQFKKYMEAKNEG